jgi:hypothetical protein
MVKRLWRYRAGVVVAGALIGCGPIRGQEAEQMTPQLVFEDFRFHVYRGSDLRATGRAREVGYRRDTADVTARDIELYMPQMGTNPAFNLKSGQGEGNARRQEFLAGGGLQLTTVDGQVVETAEARYLEAEGLIRGDHPVFIRGPSFGLRGDRFYIEPKTGIVTVQGNLALVARTPGRR